MKLPKYAKGEISKRFMNKKATNCQKVTDDYTNIKQFPITEADIGRWFMYEDTSYKLLTVGTSHWFFEGEDGQNRVLPIVIDSYLDKIPMKRIIPQPKHEFKDDDLYLGLGLDPYDGWKVDIGVYSHKEMEIILGAAVYAYIIPFNEYLFKTPPDDWPEHIQYIYGIKE